MGLFCYFIQRRTKVCYFVVLCATLREVYLALCKIEGNYIVLSLSLSIWCVEGGGNNDWLMRFSRGGDNLKINPILENDLFETERGGGGERRFDANGIRCEIL